eukprot:COSAG01_NODE_1254_length_11042_cov_37.493192_4_plen_358_part_00
MGWITIADNVIPKDAEAYKKAKAKALLVQPSWWILCVLNLTQTRMVWETYIGTRLLLLGYSSPSSLHNTALMECGFEAIPQMIFQSYVLCVDLVDPMQPHIPWVRYASIVWSLRSILEFASLPKLGGDRTNWYWKLSFCLLQIVHFIIRAGAFCLFGIALSTTAYAIVYFFASLSVSGAVFRCVTWSFDVLGVTFFQKPRFELTESITWKERLYTAVFCSAVTSMLALKFDSEYKVAHNLSSARVSVQELGLFVIKLSESWIIFSLSLRWGVHDNNPDSSLSDLHDHDFSDNTRGTLFTTAAILTTIDVSCYIFAANCPRSDNDEWGYCTKGGPRKLLGMTGGICLAITAAYFFAGA